MKKAWLILAGLMFSSFVFSQSIKLYQDVKGDTIVSKNGPNRKNFTHFYMGYGFIVGKPDGKGSEIKQGASTNFEFGYRYKLKVCNFYAVGLDFAFDEYFFHIAQKNTKITPDTILNDKESLNIFNVGAGIYNRFNFGRRGNYIGRFIDLGGYADWGFSNQHYTKNEMPNGNIVKTTVSRLTYVEPFNYGVYAHVGFNRYVFTFKYRLTDLFKESYPYPELPRYTVGLQLGFHK